MTSPRRFGLRLGSGKLDDDDSARQNVAEPLGIAGDSQSRHRVLPARVRLFDGEALDGFLERLAVANGIEGPALTKLLTGPCAAGIGTTAFMMAKPDPNFVSRVEELSGVDRRSIEAATLVRYDGGLPLLMTGLDPRKRHTFRSVVAQGWFPPFGSQVCPLCLGDFGIWRLEWRLPLIAVCTEHRRYLLWQCGACRKRFRTRERSPLRPGLGAKQLCGNTVGLRLACEHEITADQTETAYAGELEVTETIKKAIAGEAITTLGRLVSPQVFLAELRHLATLILHLATRPSALDCVDWAEQLHREAKRRTTELRGPRWGFSPPSSARVRAASLSAANVILTQPDSVAGGQRLAPWIELIRDVPNGPSAWLVNRTTRTPIMQDLIYGATLGRHHVARRMKSKAIEGLPLCAIPQLIDLDIYRNLFGGIFGGYEWTGRLYVSLCISKAVSSSITWSAAAESIGLHPEIGTRTARAASVRLLVSPDHLAHVLHEAIKLISPERDFRARECRVVELLGSASEWFDRWRLLSSPARRSGSFPYVVTWMWCEVAQGLLNESPVWLAPVSRRSKARYRAFRDSISAVGQDGLRALVLGNR